MVLIERDEWPIIERQRVDDALRRARWWQTVEPHKCAFWSVFDSTLLAHYPECRFKQGQQVTLGDFGENGGASA
ncbi:hypothetical protein SAMN05216388_101311 [Halorientalis persicus]|uniref:Uncharacterized protein n=1 Tax=Halorientalis persicus TaxID=1367881 RepID=A0A1H8PZZ1_9EURY|nr:hypothetical protein [Halorientalis persicus]SEO47301.1 hypothetical protein SAMN05216388_101311 [Halorientalis persicus]